MKDIEKLSDYEFEKLINEITIKNLDEDGDEIKIEKFDDEVKNKDFSKYMSFATSYIYTILSPVILLLGIYLLLEKKYSFNRNNKLIIILIFLGLISGYWLLYKEINDITKKKEGQNEIKNKKIK